MNEIKSKITMELQQRSWHPPVDVVQNDRYMRVLELTLTAAGENWTIPADAAVLIRYLRADGTGGTYDTLADGTSAWRASGNVLTVVLAPQLMAVSGPARLWVTLIQAERQISSFDLALNVTALSEGNPQEGEATLNVTGFLPAPVTANVGQYFKITGINEQGKVTGVEAVDLGSQALLHSSQDLTEAQKAQARANIGAVTVADVLNALPTWEGGAY